MEEDENLESLRLRKLVEDYIIEADKEKMAILLGSSKIYEDVSVGNPKICSNVKTSPPMKTHSYAKISQPVKTCYHATSPPIKQTRADIDPKDIHSHICLLKNMESLLAMKNKRSILNDSKNRYIPCAIPLSPPIRLKKDEYVNLQSSSIHNDGLDHALPNPVSASSFYSNSSFSLKHTCDRPFSDHMNRLSSPVHTCEKSSNYITNEKSLPSLPVFHNERNTKEVIETHKQKDNDQKPQLVVHDKCFADFRNSNGSFFSRKNMNDSLEEKEICERKLDGRNKESFIENPVSKHSKSEDEKNRFHFEVSLDDNSTKDVINKMLQKIPDIIDKFGTSSHHKISDWSSLKEETQMKEQDFHPCTSNIPRPSKIVLKPKETASIYTQTVSEEHSYTQRPIKILDIQSKIYSTSTQTDINFEESLPKKNELQHLIKDIVLQTLQEMQISNSKLVLPIHKVDSGIQSEVESDLKNGPFQDQQSCKSQKEYILLSKCVQTEIDFLLTTPEKNVQDRSSFTEYPQHSFDKSKEVFSIASNRKENTGHEFPGRNLTSANNPGDKIEMMLEKIYEHVCKEKESSKNFSDSSFQNYLNTRDVAVQFNPLHTSTKSTLTLEIKHKDSACQSDIPFKMNSDQYPFVDASVQVEILTVPFKDNNVLIDASTQYEQKNVLNAFAQTEIMVNLEHSATNTSASTTPVSDFMDDLISEGEIPLPWNLRLLSDSGGSMSVNNADSSDTSTREKDYSLSEGEIPPHKIYYWSLCTNLENEDAKKLDGSYFCGRNIQMQSFNSSLSEEEYNSNTSLSLGEVPPDFRASILYPSSKVENHPSLRSSSPGRDKFQCDNLATSIVPQNRDMLGCSQNSDISVQEHEKVCGKIDLKNLPQGVLPTVEEEMHSIDDQIIK